MEVEQLEENISYHPTKTTNQFHYDDSFVRIMMGPVGCGKSVGNLAEIFMRGCRQAPGSDGVRHSRWGVVRNTYPELKSTTIKTWQEWFPPHVFGPIKWDSPISHRLYLVPADGIPVDIEILFLALEGERDVKKLKSFEFTGIYINELQYINYRILDACIERVGRFPAERSGAPITWSGVIADTNPPPTSHWIYEIFEKKPPKNFRMFKFEPALLKISEGDYYADTRTATSRDGTTYITNPDADYIKNIPAGAEYYLTKVPLKDDEEIKVSFLGDYGILVSGKPIHPEYKDRLHYANRVIEADSTIELGLGWDFGLTPAVAIVQMTAFGQFIVLDELYSDYMDLEAFTENIVIPHLDRYYPFWRKNYISRHDPAGQGESQIDRRTCQDVLKKFGIKSLPAASNNAPMPRRNGLKYHMRRLTNGEPAFLMSNKCQRLREGLLGQFQYGLIQSREGSESRYHEKPLKNLYSHICEGLEYIAMHYSAEANAPDRETKSQLANDLSQQFNRNRRLWENAYVQR